MVEEEECHDGQIPQKVYWLDLEFGSGCKVDYTFVLFDVYVSGCVCRIFCHSGQLACMICLVRKYEMSRSIDTTLDEIYWREMVCMYDQRLSALAGRPVVSGAGVRGMRGLHKSVTVTPPGLVRVSLILSIALS